MVLVLRPRYGASLQVLKVEIGGDTQPLNSAILPVGKFRLQPVGVTFFFHSRSMKNDGFIRVEEPRTLER